jgi:hypothetical protein
MFTKGDPIAITAGQKGGRRRAEKLSPARIRSIARKAAGARWKSPAQREAHRARMLAFADKLRAAGLLAPKEKS